MKTVGGSQDHLKWIERALTNPKACSFTKSQALRVAEERGIDVSRFDNVRRLQP